MSSFAMLYSRSQRAFRDAAEQPGTAFVAIPGVDLDEMLCIQEERQVRNDNCVSFNRLKLQIPESPLRPHFVKARVKVRLSRWKPRHLSWAALSGPLRQKGAFRDDKNAA